MIPWFVAVVFFCVYLQYYSANPSCMYSGLEKRTTGRRRDVHHGHCTENSSTGTSRPRTKALRTHMPTVQQPSIAPEPCFAWAPVLVFLSNSSSYSYKCGFRQPYSTEGYCGSTRWPLYRQSATLAPLLQLRPQAKSAIN